MMYAVLGRCLPVVLFRSLHHLHSREFRGLICTFGLLSSLACAAAGQNVSYSSHSGTTGSGGAANIDSPNLVEPGERVTVTSLFPTATVLVVPRLAVAGGGGPVLGEPFFATFAGAVFKVPTTPSLLGITFELDPIQILPTANALDGQ